MTPIWKDYLTQLAATAPSGGFAYTIYHSDGVGSGSTVFAGTAYARPGQTALKVRINDVVAGLLRRGFTPAGETDIPYAEVRVNDSDDNVLDTETFYADWSYDPGFDYLTDDLNIPVLDTLLPGQLVPLTRHRPLRP